MPSAAPPEPSIAWSPPPPVLTFCAHEVHVWRAELDGGGETDVERLATTLAPDERARAASFVFAPDRRRFTLGRVALRSVLARYLDVEPGAVTLGRTPEGRPALIGALAGALHFSVSRSAGLALCAPNDVLGLAFNLVAIHDITSPEFLFSMAAIQTALLRPLRSWKISAITASTSRICMNPPSV